MLQERAGWRAKVVMPMTDKLILYGILVVCFAATLFSLHYLKRIRVDVEENYY